MRRKSFSVREIATIPLFTALTAALGFVAVPLPFSPVPITGQTLGVMLAGTVLGKRNGAMSMLLFLLLGAAGLPVFAGATAGIGMLLGPRGGYLLSWPLVAWLSGWVVARRKPVGLWGYLLSNLLFGVLLVYAAGVTQLAYVMEIPWSAAVVSGALPFIPGDILKAIAAALIAIRLSPLIPSGDR